MSLLPSQTLDRFWIQEWAPGARGGGPRVGKWIVTIDEADLDRAWTEVREALANGLLGTSAKARTARRHPFVKPDGKTVICVYTYDSEDRQDRARVARMLNNLGFQDKRYKTDAQTRRDWHSCLPSSQVEG